MAKESVKGKAYARVDISHDELIALARVVQFWDEGHPDDVPLTEEEQLTLDHLCLFVAKLPDADEIDEMVPPGMLSEEDVVDLNELAQAVAQLFRDAMVGGVLEEDGTGVLRLTKVDD